MNAKECRFCKHCDPNRTNDIEQVRCKRFSTFVNLFDKCDYFATDSEWLNTLRTVNEK